MSVGGRDRVAPAWGQRWRHPDSGRVITLGDRMPTTRSGDEAWEVTDGLRPDEPPWIDTAKLAWWTHVEGS